MIDTFCNEIKLRYTANGDIDLSGRKYQKANRVRIEYLPALRSNNTHKVIRYDDQL